MIRFWQRWRAPIVGGVAIWLVSVPLLTSQPQATVKPGLRLQAAVAADAADRALVQEVRRQHLALAAATSAASVSAATAQAANRRPVAHATLVVAPPRPPAAAIAAVRANSIVIPRLGVNLPVGWYTDCMGRAAVPRWGAWRWSCAGANNTYIMAHNPGTFTPILGLRAGDLIEYGDPSGRVHTYRVQFTTIVYNTQLWPLGATAAPSLTLQTCWTWDGTRDFIVRAIQIS